MRVLQGRCPVPEHLDLSQTPESLNGRDLRLTVVRYRAVTAGELLVRATLHTLLDSPKTGTNKP